MVRADTIAWRVQPDSVCLRSKRSISSTSLWAARVMETVAVFKPQAAASFIAMNSAFTTLYVSLLAENLAMSFFVPSSISALGRAPPIEVP
ncbi:hypothetical protein D3C87_1586090 [compost metagenome]